jgi:hypothetical protein
LGAGAAADVAAGAAAGDGDGAGVAADIGGACIGACIGGAFVVPTGVATAGGVTVALADAATAAGGAVSTVATGADEDGVAAAGFDAGELTDGESVASTVGGAGSIKPAVGAATSLGASTTGIAGTNDSPNSPAAVRSPTPSAPARVALRGRRSALSAAMRSAAGFVFAKPAV